MELLVGINFEYITIIDEQKKELLLTRYISDCSWFKSTEQVKSRYNKLFCLFRAKDHDEDVPSFFIHFPDDKALSEDGSQPATPSTDHQQNPQESVFVSRLLQIFSKQSSLMENLLNVFYEKSESDLGSTEELHSPGSSNGVTGQTPQSEIVSSLNFWIRRATSPV